MTSMPSSSHRPILFASFNQINSGFAISTKEGFKIFDSNTARLCYLPAIGGFIVVEMLHSFSLLGIVGAGKTAVCSCLFNTTTGTALREFIWIKRVFLLFKPGNFGHY